MITLDHGRILYFAWDNGCQGCDTSDCMSGAKSLNSTGLALPGVEHFSAGTCGRRRTECITGGLACDLKVFVTWAGTDRTGRHLLSASLRFSKFTGSTLAGMYERLTGGYSSLVSR